MRNGFIRQKIKDSGFSQWEVAEAMGVSEFTFCRWLRKEFDAQKIEQVLSVIEILKKGDDANG